MGGLHIDVLEMNAFLPRIVAESVVLMSDNTTVMAYLKKQEGTFSRVMCSFGSGDCRLRPALGDFDHQIHPREEHRSGPVEPSRLGPSLWVVPTSLGVWCHLRGIQSFLWRLICYQSKHKASILCVFSSRSHVMKARCFSTSWEWSLQWHHHTRWWWKIGCVQFERFWLCESPNFTWEWSTMASTQD